MMDNGKNSQVELPPMPRIEITCATPGVKITIGILALAWSGLLICLYTIPTPDVALWLSIAAYTIMVSPRKVILEGDWLNVKWLAWEKSYHLASLEGVYLDERIGIVEAVACFRDKQPLAIPLWRSFPGSYEDDRFRFAAHLSRVASKNSIAEADTYGRSEMTLSLHHNRLAHSLAFMALGVIFTAGTLAYFLYHSDWKMSGELFWAVPIAIASMGFGLYFIFLLVRPSIGVSPRGVRIIPRLGQSREFTNAHVDLFAGNYHGLAVSPKILFRFGNNTGEKIEVTGDYSSFFIALRLFQKWPDDRFTIHMHDFIPKNAEDSDARLTREFRKKFNIENMKRRRTGLPVAESGIKGSILSRKEAFHPLADPAELFNSVEEMLGLI